MEKVKQYLTEYIDERAEIRECPEGITNSMPLVLKAAFDWYELTIMEEKVLLLKPVQKQTVYRLKNWTEQIEKSCGMNTILLMEDATPYMVKKMLSDRMAFVIPGKQISIPASGPYHAALLRAEGSYDYTPVNTMEFMLSDKTSVGDTDGIKVFANAFTEGTSAINTVRWDAPYMAGQVESRGASLVYLKDAE